MKGENIVFPCFTYSIELNMYTKWRSEFYVCKQWEKRQKEKQDNPNWGGRVDTDIHEKLEKFYEESGFEKKGDFIKLLSDLASVHFAEEAMKDDFAGEYSKHYVELSKELASYLLKVKHLFLKEVGGERVRWRELNQEFYNKRKTISVWSRTGM